MTSRAFREVGEPKDFILKRATEMGLTFQPDQFSTVFWDVFGEQGHPVRATVTEMGPLLLSRMLDLNDVQEGVLNVAFRVADDNGLALIDMKDLRALLDAIVPDSSKKPAMALRIRWRRSARPRKASAMSPAPPSAPSSASSWCWRTRAARNFSASRRCRLKDFMRTDRDGRGMINILVADKLMQSPRLYATFLLWMLSELFEELPEAGDLPKPKLVFFFDEAHLLFNDAPKALMDKIEQVVRLIRSKGVGVYFVTQNPIDVPDTRARPARQPRAACAARRSRRATRRRSRPPRRPSARTRSSTPPRSSWSSARARRWCRSWKATARRRWSSA